MADLWLSRVVLNPRSVAVQKDMANAAGLHRRVMSLFPEVDDIAARQAMSVMHRVDDSARGATLLVQSALPADPLKLPQDYGAWASTELDRLLNRLENGTLLRYRIVVNATKRVGAGPQAGKRIALGPEATREWWSKRASEAGLSLTSPPAFTGMTITGRDSTDGRITIRPWRVDGGADVADASLVRAAMATGIGRGKAFGCGLLSIAIVG